MARTLFDQVWDAHEVDQREDGASLLYIDCHLLHEGSRRPFEILAERGIRVRRPDRTWAMADHYAPSGASAPAAAHNAMHAALRANAAASGATLLDEGDEGHGIVHVAGPELGLSLPGQTLVCGDSHTSTHGALGTLAFGIGATEVAHVLATQCLWQKRPRQMRVTINGALRPGVGAKDLALALILRIGASGATGHAVEFTASAVAALSVEGRLTLCNMAIEAGGRCAMIAPDEITAAWLRGKPGAPSGVEWDRVRATWLALRSDPGVVFDRDVELDAAEVMPMLTWGTNPAQAVTLGGVIGDEPGASLDYMGLQAGQALTGLPFNRVFVGSCTNGRLSDLREALAGLSGRRCSIPMLVVPGSVQVARAAQAEGIEDAFRSAGAVWGAPGCSMCVGLNGDLGQPSERIASTSNRNFAGRQGQGVRTHLVGPRLAGVIAALGRLPSLDEWPA